MSMERKERTQCPQCGKDIEVTIWSSLNSDLSPDAKKALISGILFKFICPHCGFKINLNYGILYHDMTHRAMVYHVSEESVEQTKAIFNSVDAKQDFEMSGYRKRIVTNQNALREKAIIFDNELDDRVIELIKCIYLAQAQQQYPDANIDAIYFQIVDGQYILQFLGNTPLSAEIDRNMYDDIATKCSDLIADESDKEFIIDLDWARRVFRLE